MSRNKRNEIETESYLIMGELVDLYHLDPIDYSPSYATGNELEDRKAGIFNRDKAGDDDDRY